MQWSSSSFWLKKKWHSWVTLHICQIETLPPTTNYFAFPKLKLELKGDHYAPIEDIQKSVTAKLKALPISDFAGAMKQLKDRGNECNQVSGDYFK